MLSYIVKRLLYGLAVLVLVVVLVSSIIYLAPVDPARLTFGQRSDTASLDAKRDALGLNQALHLQLAAYLNDLSPLSVHEPTAANQKKYEYLRLFGIGQKVLVLKTPYLRESFQSGRKVSDMLWEAIPLTAILAISAILLASMIGISLGVVASLHQNSWFDNAAVFLSVLGFSLPSYVAAMLLALFFGYYLNAYTGLEVQGSLIVLDDLGDEKIVWKNLMLPCLALGIRPVAIITQLTRSAMLDVLSQDFIRTAKAKGLSRYKVVVKHALRNALNPVVTAISAWFASLLAGAIFVENVLNYQGLGKLTVTALLNFDIPLILGSVLFIACVFVVINILVDIVYAWLDPRVKLA